MIVCRYNMNEQPFALVRWALIYISVVALQLGMILDRRILRYIIPVFSFVLLYSKLPHKVHYVFCLTFKLCAFFVGFQLILVPYSSIFQELRFIIGSIPIFNVSAAITASRVYEP